MRAAGLVVAFEPVEFGLPEPSFHDRVLVHRYGEHASLALGSYGFSTDLHAPDVVVALAGA